MDSAQNTLSKRDVTYTHFKYNFVCLLLCNSIRDNVPPIACTAAQTGVIAPSQRVKHRVQSIMYVCMRIPNEYLFFVFYSLCFIYFWR